MDEINKNEPRGRSRKQSPAPALWKKLIPGICIAVGILAIVLYFVSKGDTNIPETSAAETTTEVPTIESSEAETTTAAETAPAEPTILPQLAELYEQNQDLCGWISIEDTVVDYPLMYTPDEPEKYLRLSFDGEYSVPGVPFLEDSCSLEPESDNLIIYGHNMRDGSMFHTLMSYEEEEFWQEHPSIRICTLYEEREYEVLAAFFDRVYYKYEDCFKFYQFTDAEDEAHYQEAIAYYQENALYDTGVTAEFGDRLITLVTCSKHHEYGRFVVVAREVTE